MTLLLYIGTRTGSTHGSHGRRNRGAGGGGGNPSIFCQPPKIKSWKITTYQSVYSNKVKKMLIAQWILEITDKQMHKSVSFLYVW